MNIHLVFMYIQVSLERIQLQPHREHRELCLGEVRQGRSKSKFNIIYLYFNLSLVLIFKEHFDKFQNQPPGEP